MLCILLSEVRAIGLHGIQQLGYNRRDADEVAGATRALQHTGERIHRDARRVAGRVHLLDARNEHEADACAFQHLKVACFVTGVLREVLVRAELRRVDEDRGVDALALGLRGVHQREVALVQVPHRGHQPNRAASVAPSVTECSERACDDHRARIMTW